MVFESLAALIKKSGDFKISHNRFEAERDLETLGPKITALIIEFTSEHGVLTISNKQGQYVLYTDNQLETIPPAALANPFAVLSLEGDLAEYDGTSIHFGTGCTATFRRHFEDVYSYLKLFNHFILNTDPDDLIYDGHYNATDYEIILYSSLNGILKIKYDRENPKFSAPVGELCDLLIKYSSSPYRSFFINALFAFSLNTTSITFKQIIENTRDIVAATKRDYELVQKKFDFSKFRDNLLNEKDKYFLSIRELVNKIFMQLIGVPISISVATFTLYKVQGDLIAIILVFIGFLVYAAFYIAIQFIYIRDLADLKKDFLANFGIIKSKSGLPHDLIDTEQKIILGKFRRTRRMAITLIIIVIILTLVLGGFFLYQLLPMQSNIQVIKYQN